MQTQNNTLITGQAFSLKSLKTPLMIFILLYTFLVGVSLLSGSFKLLGNDFAKSLLSATSNPFIALISGMLATTLFQSSSVTTSIVVGLVAGGALPLGSAVPVIMGANLGTSVTNTIVSFAFAKNKAQFSKAIAAATVHDFFNILTTAILFPLELATGFLQKSAAWFSSLIFGGAGVKFISPVKAAIKPASKSVLGAIKSTWSSEVAGIVAIILSAIVITVSLYFIVQITQKIVANNKTSLIETMLSKNSFISIFFGIIITIAVQSSSITTSLLVPMAGAGVLSLRAILPITVGANIGTTATALLAAMTGNIAGVTIAIVHLFFNLGGMLIWYVHPTMRKLPLFLAQNLGSLSERKRSIGLAYLVAVFFIIPLALISLFS
ncbi:MAG: Na/Pi symporter [Bacteriovoracaceae bacterium]|jgi:sodium-dependent phosphate cotransporter|nr:Na/Pi symporter [Bacteriovoracaceae bacterium]